MNELVREVLKSLKVHCSEGCMLYEKSWFSIYHTLFVDESCVIYGKLWFTYVIQLVGWLIFHINGIRVFVKALACDLLTCLHVSSILGVKI